MCIHELKTIYDLSGKSPSHEHGHGSAAWDVLHMHAHDATRIERMQATIMSRRRSGTCWSVNLT